MAPNREGTAPSGGTLKQHYRARPGDRVLLLGLAPSDLDAFVKPGQVVTVCYAGLVDDRLEVGAQYVAEFGTLTEDPRVATSEQRQRGTWGYWAPADGPCGVEEMMAAYRLGGLEAVRVMIEGAESEERAG